MVRIHHHPVAERHQFHIAGWSSLEARRAHNPEVIGSNPIPATFAQLAQLVEQRTENPRVSGSIPELGIFMSFYSLYIFIFGRLSIETQLEHEIQHLIQIQIFKTRKSESEQYTLQMGGQV